MDMKKLYVVADDFGLSPGINRAIIKCAENNILSGVSVLATGPAVEELKTFIQKFPEVEIGIHFDLISRQLLTGIEINLSPAKLALKVIFDPNILKDIDAELRCQTERLLDICKLSHIDSHRHTHYIPQIFKLVNIISEDYSINRIRIPVPKITLKNSGDIFYRKDFWKFLPFYIWRYFNKTNAASNDNFFGLFQAGNLTERYLDRILTKEEFDYAELMTHPGYVDDILLKQDDKLLFKRESELKLLLKFFGSSKAAQNIIVKSQMR